MTRQRLWFAFVSTRRTVLDTVQMARRSESRKNGQDSVSIGLEARGRLCAVALDTNAIDQGHPNIAKLTTLANRLKIIGLPLWVPEPVAWEWAEHAGQQWQEFTVASSQPYRRLMSAGVALPQVPFAQDFPAIQEAVLGAIKQIDNLVVVPLSATNAREGVRDQILQRPPGRRKSGVKTGASDSAWLRDLRDQAGGDLSRVLLVSSDGDVTSACEAWGIESPLLRSWGDLLETLFSFVLDDADSTVTRLIVSYLQDKVGQTDPSAGRGFTITVDSGEILRLVEEETDRYGDGPVTSAVVTELTALAGVVGVVVQEPDPAEPHERAVSLGVTHSALATVFFLGNVDALYMQHDQPEGIRIADVGVRVQMSFEIRDGGAVVGAEGVGEAAVFRTIWYEEEQDALNDVLDALSTVPRLGFPAEWPKEEETLSLRGPGGVEVYAELEREPWVRWALTVMIGDDPAEVAEISCEQDQGAQLIRWDPDSSNSYWVEQPFTLLVEAGGLSHQNPSWSLATWILARLRLDRPAEASGLGQQTAEAAESPQLPEATTA